jgi:hypothetical protein
MHWWCVQSRRRGRERAGNRPGMEKLIIAAVGWPSIFGPQFYCCDLHDAGWEADSSFPPTDRLYLLRRLEGDVHAIGRQVKSQPAGLRV